MANNRSPKNKIKALILLLCLILVLGLGLAVGGTVAYVMTASNAVQNEFAAGYVRSYVDGNGIVTNLGNTDAYIRAYVVVNWMDAKGNVYAIAPDYSISTNSGWTCVDGIYYYNSSVPAGQTTTNGPATVSVTGSVPSDAYTLSIEYVAEAIQAKGMGDGVNSAQAAWSAAVTRPVG